MGNICYWCGSSAVSRDHVPPRNLFPKRLRNNLVTVPACFEHNNKFTKLEERMRFFLQAGSDSPQALAEFDATTLRSLENPKAGGLLARVFTGVKPIRLPTGDSAALQIPAGDTRLYFEKIARGIHYVRCGDTFDGECTVGFRQAFAITPVMQEFFKKLVPHFRNQAYAQDGVSSHPEIFRYRVIDREEKGYRIFAVAMNFYQSIEAIALLTPLHSFEDS